MMLSKIIAFVVPIISCIQLLPQLYKTYITKSVEDLSIYSLLLFLTSNILWLLHGYFIIDYSLIVACTIGFLVNIWLLVLYFLYSRIHR